MELNLKAAYWRWVDGAKSRLGHEQAMHFAAGGEFEAFGIVEREMLRFFGLGPQDYLIDVGCGSGRLAIPLSRRHEGRYLGTDLVPDLLAYARANCVRPDWRFEVAPGLRIPEEAGRADMVCFFSVFTHLLHEQTYLYLEEARRVLKPGGRIVFSFLEFAVAGHWSVFETTVEQARKQLDAPLNVFIDRHAIEAWARRLGLHVDDIRSGEDHFVPLEAPLTLASGLVLAERAALGQSICVLSKPRAGW